MPKDEPDQAGVVILPDVLQAARDRKRKSRAANPASSDAAQRNSKSWTCNSVPHADASFKPSQFAGRQSTKAGRAEAFLRSFGTLVQAVEAARVLTPLQFLHLLMALGRIPQPGFDSRRVVPTVMDILAAGPDATRITPDTEDNTDL